MDLVSYRKQGVVGVNLALGGKYSYRRAVSGCALSGITVNLLCAIGMCAIAPCAHGSRSTSKRCAIERCTSERCAIERCAIERCPSERCPSERCPSERCPSERCQTACAMFRVCLHGVHLPRGQLYCVRLKATPFDNVLPNILISDLIDLGLSPKNCLFVYNLTHFRELQFVINGELFEPRLTYKGVPQGSILSPLLFNIYMSKCKNCFRRLPSNPIRR